MYYYGVRINKRLYVRTRKGNLINLRLLAADEWRFEHANTGTPVK